MQQRIVGFFARSPFLVLCVMTLSFLGFGYFSINLFLLFKANISLINQFGLVALQEGAAMQLFMLLVNALVSVIFYALWKVGERLLVDWVVGRPLAD